MVTVAVVKSDGGEKWRWSKVSVVKSGKMTVVKMTVVNVTVVHGDCGHNDGGQSDGGQSGGDKRDGWSKVTVVKSDGGQK